MKCERCTHSYDRNRKQLTKFIRPYLLARTSKSDEHKRGSRSTDLSSNIFLLFGRQPPEDGRAHSCHNELRILIFESPTESREEFWGSVGSFLKSISAPLTVSAAVTVTATSSVPSRGR